jgi:hypothetical protein
MDFDEEMIAALMEKNLTCCHPNHEHMKTLSCLLALYARQAKQQHGARFKVMAMQEQAKEDFGVLLRDVR